MRRRVFVSALACLIAALLWAHAGTARAEERLRIFDTHVHYSRAAWEVYSPAVVENLLKAAHVVRALVSSSPDDGTLALYGHAAQRFVPMLRPYRAGVGPDNWTRDEATPGYLADRLKKGIYKGIGEFHLWDARAARTPVLKKVARLAVARNILLHVHAGAAPVRELFGIEPRLRILWAHAGMVTPPEEVGRMLDAYEKLWAELAFREGEILAGEKLNPAWRKVLKAHPSRFMIGTDTYTNSRWEAYARLVASHRAWLKRLPRKIAAAIAHGNASRVLRVKLPQ